MVKNEVLNINPDDSDKIDFETKVIIDGREYWRSPAQYLANYIVKQQYDGFRYSVEYEFSSAKLFIEILKRPGSFFESELWSEKRCLGVLLFDVEKNRITLRKTMVDVDKHEFHKDEKRQMDECFGVQYDIFRYLRDTDLIEIHAIERKVRHKEKLVYIISILHAVRSGRFLHFKGYGIQFFIPKSAFKCFSKGKVKEKKKRVKEKK